MGFFKKIKKAFKKVVSGVKKVFKPIAKAFSKIMKNKVFRAILTVAAVVTGGIAIYGGIMGAMGAAGTQAWSTLSLTGKFVTGAKAFVSGAQAAVGSAMGTVKGALGFQGASGGTGITASAQAAGQGAAQSAFAAANPELAKLGVNLGTQTMGTSPSALANLESTGLRMADSGTSVGNINEAGLTDAVAATDAPSGISAASRDLVMSPSNPNAIGGSYSTGSGLASRTADVGYRALQTANQATAEGRRGGLLSQAGNFLSGGGGALAMIGGQALSGAMQAKSAQQSEEDQLKFLREQEAKNWYNTVTADDLAVGNFQVPQGLLSYTGSGLRRIDELGERAREDMAARAQQIYQRYGYA